jgi:transcriptional regulator with XRE-family HTH domain
MPARGLNQAELARRSGIKPNSISRYLAGLNMPRPAHLARLAAALEVEVHDLLVEESAAPPAPAGNLLCLTQTSATSGMVRLQVDQMLPGELATRVVALLLQECPERADPEDAAPSNIDSDKSHARPRPVSRKGTLVDILQPRTPREPEHARQVLRLDGPPQRPANGGTRT